MTTTLQEPCTRRRPSASGDIGSIRATRAVDFSMPSAYPYMT